MKAWIQISLICILPMAAFAAVSGQIVNQSTGKPESDVIVNLVQPDAGGMRIRSSTRSDRAGLFSMNPDVSGGPVTLLQALYKGATYNMVLQPGVPTSNLNVKVYDSTSKRNLIHITEHVVFIQLKGTTMQIDETLVIQNESSFTFRDKRGGSLNFYISASALRFPLCDLKAPDGMPIRRPLEKTAKVEIYKIDFPIKPGESQVSVSYLLPTSVTFTGRNFYPERPVRLITSPSVILSGDGIAPLGQEPHTQANIYSVGGTAYLVKVSGIDESPKDNADRPSVEEVSPRLYTKLVWILGFALSSLFVAGCILYRRSPQT